jgi:hypothetical protein
MDNKMKIVLKMDHLVTVRLTKYGALALNNRFKYIGSSTVVVEGQEYTDTISNIMKIFGEYIYDVNDHPFNEIEIG